MIKRAGTQDLEVLAELANMMWTNHSVDELITKFAEIMDKNQSAFFLKYDSDNPIGFAQCQLRYDYVEGTTTSPVGYLEGIFVRKEYQNKGYARELFIECETWAKQHGCHEFASDCEVENEMSQRFHMAMNFTEVNRIVCFTKNI